MRVLVAGGGTAGHVNPALALGRALEGEDVLFVGTELGSEARLVPGAGFPLEKIVVRGFDRSRPWSLVPVGATALKAVRQARSILRRFNPDVVVGMGGYVALPVCTAARLARIPIVIHEQNIVFGLTNRVCKRFARRIAVSFEETLADAGSRGINTGNPVLPHIAEMDHDLERKNALRRYTLDPGRTTLLVFGGSQGAKRINDAVPGLVTLWADKADRQILHITGARQSDLAPDDAADRTLIYRRIDFVERMQEPYAVADVALCRGGATTVAELGAVGLPAVIVPYPYHRDKQQERHALALQRAGAARVLNDSETTPAGVAEVVEDLFENDERLLSMKEAARSFGRPDAARALADVVREVAA
ncbi:MAG: undecaprenyldiphospho-muramoylpentapeptide beta-N-acetylglucosaminyltransferase [Actinomycetota bacterium]|nr:undecaprenyldiphospho-muramoylpentapeptide beta-N-acetylglucosaminyltransferase [Actinomycetota bacterium]